MNDSLTFGFVSLWMMVAAGCSSSNDAALAQTQTGATGGASSGSGGASANTGGSTVGGANHAGGSGASTGGGTGGGAANAGGTSSTGGTNAGGSSTGGAASTGGSTGAGGSVTGNGGSDAGSSRLCGSDPCTPTRCAGIGCGPAVCCHGPNGPVCIHGASECPASDGGVRTETLACFGGSSSADFAKSCIADRDCIVADHWAGCCHIEAIGLNASEKSLFDAFETTCGGAPPCGCCCDRTTSEDGKTVTAGGTVSVACVDGMCTTKTP